MRKSIIGILCGLVCAMGVSGIVYAQNADKQTVEIANWKEDMKKNVLQAGGLLDEDAYASKREILGIQSQEAEWETAMYEAMQSHASKLDLTKYHISAREFSSLLSRFMNSRPELFFVNPYDSVTHWNRKSGEVVDIYLTYYWNETQSGMKIAEYEAAIDRAVKNVDMSWSDLEKALYINDYLCENITYDNKLQYYDAYHGLVEGTTVCQGYALAYMALAERMGLDTQMVTSRSLNHAWNMVKVNGKYYHVDSTWNDNIYENGSLSHYYFMKSTLSFQSDDYGDGTGHKASDYVIMGSWTPEMANDRTYDMEHMWKKYHSTFNYLNGIWYTYDDEKGQIIGYSCNKGNFQQVSSKQLPSYLKPSGREGRFSSVGEYEGKLYYCLGRDGVYEWNPKNGEEKLVYQYPEELTVNKGYMVYMNMDSYGRISYMYFDGTNLKEKNNAFSLGQDTYRITYHLNGGSLEEELPTEYQSLDKTFLLEDPDRDGYEFMGWYSDSAYETPITCIAKGSYGDKDIYAQWAKIYTINYKLKGGKNSSSNPESYTKYSKNITLKNPTKKGYKFMGWYSDSSYKNKVKKITMGTTGNKVLYAKWKKK